MTRFNQLYAVLSATLHEIDTRKGDRGAAMVEYALLVAGMALVVAAAVALFGTKITAFINGISL